MSRSESNTSVHLHQHFGNCFAIANNKGTDQTVRIMDHNVTHFTFELEHDKTNKMTCAISEDSGQSERPPNLIRVFVVRCMDS